jgi:hypothetical protein
MGSTVIRKCNIDTYIFSSRLRAVRTGGGGGSDRRVRGGDWAYGPARASPVLCAGRTRFLGFAGSQCGSGRPSDKAQSECLCLCLASPVTRVTILRVSSPSS